MAPSAKTQYLGYHMVYDCEEGFDVPMSAFERQHHRERHRPAAKPGAHGGERLSRHHVRPRLLARCHSLPVGDEEPMTPYREEDEKRAPPLPRREPPAAAPQAPPSFEVEAAAAEAPGWADFAGRLVAEAPGGAPQQWPRRGGSSASETGDGGVAKATAGDAKDLMVDAGTAKAAARSLPALLRSAGVEEGGEKIPMGRMKELLESAVSLASQRRAPPQASELAPANGDQRDVAEEEMEAFSGSRDLRGKGWMRLHKSGRGMKKLEKVSLQAARRLEQFDEAIGYVSAGEPLGMSWAHCDRARSKQHGGDVRFRRAASGHYE